MHLKNIIHIQEIKVVPRRKIIDTKKVLHRKNFRLLVNGHYKKITKVIIDCFSQSFSDCKYSIINYFVLIILL